MTIVDVVFRSATGKSILQKEQSETDLTQYASTKEVQDEAIRALSKLGFELAGPPSPYGVSISGSSQLVHDVFGDEPLKVPKSLTKWIESVRISPQVKFYGKRLKE